jgi:hypothetical protein
MAAGAGHLSNVEAPERFNADVRSFLKDHIGKPVGCARAHVFK